MSSCWGHFGVILASKFAGFFDLVSGGVSGAFRAPFGRRLGVIFGAFGVQNGSRRTSGGKNVIFKKTYKNMSVFDDFEVRRGQKCRSFWSRGRLFRRPKTPSIRGSILDGKSGQKELIWTPFGSQMRFKIESKIGRQKSEKREPFYAAPGSDLRNVRGIWGGI